MNQEILLEKPTLELFKKCNLEISNFKIEKESSAYNACTFQLNNSKIIFRKAKITPTKIGQFVTLWKRNSEAVTVPFSISDQFDSVIIYVKKENTCGKFIFPKVILIEKGIISSDKKVGKRSFRVYPIWDKAENKQAIQTQKWQLNYFMELPFETPINVAKAKKMFANS